MPVANHKVLLEKLVQIERSIGIETNFTLQKMLLEAEEYLLELEKERVANLRPNAHPPVLTGRAAKADSVLLRAQLRDALQRAVRTYRPDSA